MGRFPSSRELQTTLYESLLACFHCPMSQVWDVSSEDCHESVMFPYFFILTLRKLPAGINTYCIYCTRFCRDSPTCGAEKSCLILWDLIGRALIRFLPVRFNNLWNRILYFSASYKAAKQGCIVLAVAIRKETCSLIRVLLVDSVWGTSLCWA